MFIDYDPHVASGDGYREHGNDAISTWSVQWWVGVSLSRAVFDQTCV